MQPTTVEPASPANDVTDAPESAASKRSLFNVFALAWAMAVLFHQAQWNYWLEGPLETAMSAAALLVVLRPTSVPRFIALNALVVLAILDELPWVSNHWIFSFFVALTVLCGTAVAWFRRNGGPLTGEAIYDAFAPVVRIQLVILYGFAVLHKLNWDFFNLDLSCGTTYYYSLRGQLPFLPDTDWAKWAAILGTLIIELAIPALLIFRSTRFYGVAMGVAFHFMLGTPQHPNFSAVATACLLLFIPLESVETVAGRLRGWGLGAAMEKLYRLWRVAVTPASVLVVVAGLVGLFFAHWGDGNQLWLVREPWSEAWRRQNLAGMIARGTKYLWPLYGGIVFAAVLLAARRDRKEVPDALAPRPSWLWLLPILLIVNGMAPYFGLKTEYSFSMFSNLRTEAEPNHLFLAGMPHLTGLQSDWVTVLKSSDPQLTALAAKGAPITWWEFRSYTARKTAYGQGDFSVSYIRGNSDTPIVVESVAQDPELSRPDSPVLRKVFAFRPIRLGAANTCGH